MVAAVMIDDVGYFLVVISFVQCCITVLTCVATGADVPRDKRLCAAVALVCP